MQHYKGFQYTPESQTEWDRLPMSEKADMIKVCVRNGILDLQDIRTTYNNYKAGRNIFEGITDYRQKSSEFCHFLSTGGHVYDGTKENTQQMRIGRDYWQSQTPQPFFNLDFPINGGTLQEVVVTGSKDKYEEARRKRLAEMQAVLDKYQNDYLTTSNDNTWVESRDPRVQATRQKNPHLSDRAVKGAKAHAAWEKEHPNLTAWGNVLGAVPFAVAAYPLAATIGSGVAALGDAAAATPVGQGLTNFLAPVATSTIAGAPAMEWANIGLSSLSAAHGASQAIEDGGISPMTALEMTPVLQVAKPMVNEAALAVENYRYPIGRPQVPEGYFTIKPQVRTRVGDVEIDNPNLLYHLDRGDGSGAFSNQGAYIVDGFLMPGTPKDASAVPYSWWNEGKPYSTSVKGQPMTRLMTATKDTPGMTHVRSQSYPIGQWNGKKGFILNSEYVNPEGVDVSRSTYTLDPNYGWKRLFVEGSPAIQWSKAVEEANANPTDKILTWLGRSSTYKPKTPLSNADLSTLQGQGSTEKYPGLVRMVKIWEREGVDLSRIGVEDLDKIYNQRWSALMKDRPDRFSIIEPVGISGYNLTDYQGLRPVGSGQVLTHDSGNLYFGNITNNTRFDEVPIKGVFERGLNSILNVAHSEGRNGVITGEQYLSAPRQIPVVEKFVEKQVLPDRGYHSNFNLVKDYRKRNKLPLFNWNDEEKIVSSLSDMKAAGETQEVIFPNAPAWLLTQPTFHVPTKATIFSPRSIDASGNMIINWSDSNIFKGLGGYIKR